MGKGKRRNRGRSNSNLSNDSIMRSKSRARSTNGARPARKLSIGSNGEKFTHKEALLNKFDVITLKQANNICIAELPVAYQNYENESEHGKVTPPKGFYNMGNTCFLNSTLQCLLHTIPLKNYLLSKIHRAKCKVDGYCPFCSVENFMIEVMTKTQKVVKPSDIVMQLKKSWRQYKFGRQEDAHEFLVMLLQGMLKASFGNRGKLLKKYEHLSMLYRIFAGKHRSQVKCLSCGYCSDLIEPFLALSLDVSHGNTFESCIRGFCQPEILDGDNKYRCGGCEKLSKAKKRMTFYKPPRILTVQFLRFTMTGRKIDKFIKFPKCFNLRAFVSENVDSNKPKEEQSNHIYDLYGVVVHQGRGSNCGHYYSFVKKGGIWFRCDDQTVREVNNIDQVLQQKAYMLFYQYRIERPKDPQACNKAKLQALPQQPELYPSATLRLDRTKSLTAEILEAQQNKNTRMPLSGFIDSKEEENSDEEEEKLVTKDDIDPAQQEEYSKLDYILQNFEDVNFNDLGDFGLMRSLSVVSLNDDLPKTPELKQMISNRLECLKATAKNTKASETSQSKPTLDEIDTPSLVKKSTSSSFQVPEPKAAKKRDLKLSHKTEHDSSDDANKPEGSPPTADSTNSPNKSQTSNSGKKKRNRNKRKANMSNGGSKTDAKLHSLAEKLKN